MTDLNDAETWMQSTYEKLDQSLAKLKTGAADDWRIAFAQEIVGDTLAVVGRALIDLQDLTDPNAQPAKSLAAWRETRAKQTDPEGWD